MALMRALKTRFGTAETLASISWPIRTCAMSCSKIWAFSHIVERSAIIQGVSGSDLTCCPGPTLRETMVPPIGAVMGDAAEHAMLLEFSKFRHRYGPESAAERGPLRSVVSVDRRSFSALASCASATCEILGRGSLALMKIADALLDDLRQIVLRTRLRFGRLGRDEIVLREQLLGAVDFQGAGRPA